MGSKNGRRKVIQKGKVDRISNLPNELLSNILSFLPTKCAVGTSILSNRWRYLWTSITSFHFESPSGSSTDPNVVNFANFVDHVFRSCNSSHVQKLILDCPWSWSIESRVTAWIDEGIKRSVSELDLNVHKFPLSIFSCTTVTALTLNYCYNYCYNNDAEVFSINLPCLRVLHIKGRLSLLMEKLISSCPMLEDLTLGGSGSTCYTNDTFMVSAHTLKTLRLQLETYYFTGEVFVEAPNLEYLHLNESFIHYNIKGIFSSLVKAYVNIGQYSIHHIFQDLNRRFTLPNFSYLKYLEVTTCDNRLWEMLPKIIRSTPSLEVLSLKQEDGHDNETDDECDWVEPKSVAKCVGHRLQVIEVEGFKGREHELQLLKYLIGRAKVLRRLTVNCQRLKRQEERKFVGQLLKFSRASKYCEVEFHGNVISNI